MQTERERKVIEKIVEQYGSVVDLEREPGVVIEILRNFGPNILQVLGAHGIEEGGLSGGVSSIAIAGPGTGNVTMEDLMRVILQAREEIIKLSAQVVALREEIVKVSGGTRSR